MANQAQDRRKEYIVVLSSFMTRLRNSCPVCWAWKGKFFPKHTPMVHCRVELKVNFISFGMGWIDFKNACQPTTSVKYCYGCSLPLGKFIPQCHAKESPKRTCSFADIIALSLWVVYHDKELKKKMCEEFELDEKLDLVDYIEWLKDTPLKDHFCNFIRVFLWLADFREL